MRAKHVHFFSTDHPIERLGADLLQRRGFAVSIARAMTRWEGEDSLVMALYGGWGDGKSSVKKMVVDAMDRDQATCPYIVHFNPWEWAGQNQLAQVFFEEIGKQIAHAGSGDEGKKSQECGRWLQRLGKCLNLGGKFVKVLGYAASVKDPHYGDVANTVAEGLAKSGELANQGAEVCDALNEDANPDLQMVKSELKEALKVLKRNVVVVIDDIDRLAADEISLLFQLVKANADFPNLIFFLLFQRDVVERALGRAIRAGSGKEYLEKIVQVPLSLPQIQRPLLEKFMDFKLNKLLVRRKLKKRFDWSRFRELWVGGLNEYFHNLRDVVRFFGTFEFQVAAFHAPGEFDAVDLFALEVLRVFEAGVYDVLATSRHLLESENYAQFDHDRQGLDVSELWTKSIQRVIDEGRADRPLAAGAVLKKLFPIETFAIKLRTPEYLARLQRQARVGHPAYFGRYFHLCIPQGDIRQAEIVKLLAAAGDEIKFKRMLNKLDKQGLVLEALTRMSTYTERFAAANTGAITSVLFDEGDRFVSKYGNDPWGGFAAMAWILIEAHLEKWPTRDQRFELLRSAFEKSEGVYLPSQVLRHEESRCAEEVDGNGVQAVSRDARGVFENSQLDELRRICIKRIVKAAESGSLKSHSKLLELLVWWKRWSSSTDASKTYFQKLVATAEGLSVLLEQFFGNKLDENSSEAVIDRFFGRGLIELEQFMPVADFKMRVKELSATRLSERQARLCMVFMKRCSEHEQHKSLPTVASVLEPRAKADSGVDS